MKNNYSNIYLFMLFISIFAAGCMGGGSSSEPVEIEKELTNVPPGTSGVAFAISDSASGQGLSEARVLILTKGALSPMVSRRQGAMKSVAHKAAASYSSSMTDFTAKIVDTDMTGSGNVTAHLVPGEYEAYLQRPAYEDYLIPEIKIEGVKPIAAAYEIKLESIDEGLIDLIGACQGYVKSVNGSAVSGALVTLSGKSGTYTTAADERGNWIKYNIPAGEYNVYSTYSGYKSAEVKAHKITAGITTNVPDLVLENAVLHTLSGRVTDKNNIPLKGICVQLQNRKTNQPVLQTAVSGADGTFSISGIEAGEFYVYAGLNMIETYYTFRETILLGYEYVSTGNMQSTLEKVDKPEKNMGDIIMNIR